MKHRGLTVVAISLAALAMAVALIGGERAAAANIDVTTATDELNSDGDCSLREALRAANLNVAVDGCLAGGVGVDTISLDPVTYTLSIPGQNENAAATGDLDIAGNFITINGSGAGSTTIDGGGIDRVFDVIFNSNQVIISNLRIENGATAVATPGNGGGITVGSNANVTLNNVVINGNSTPLSGGGINVGGNLTVNNSTISGNTATSSGGGINVSTSTGNLTLNNSTVSGNYALGTGGAGIDNRNVAHLTSVTISANTATGGTSGGGGILHGNAANASMDLTNVTVTGNYAGSGGGGGIRHTATGNNPVLANVLVAGNTGGNCSGALLPSGPNLDSGATCGFSISSSDPLLGPLAANGGATQTHSIPGNSPAVNSGTNSGCPSTDQRGIARQGTCDIGAYEYDGAPAPTPTPTPSPSPSLTPTPSPSPSPTPTPSPSPSLTPTPSASPSPTPTPTPSPSPSPTPTPTATPSPTSSLTPTPSPTTPTPTPTPTATSTPTPTPTPSPAPAPTPTPASAQRPFGDVDCSGQVNSIDALKLLRFSSGLGYSQNEPCKKIGIEVLANGKIQGDVDCSNSVNSIDALKISRYSAALSYNQNEPCPDIGSFD